MKTTKAYMQPLADGGPSICGSYSRIPGDGLRKVVIRWASDDRALMRLLRRIADEDDAYYVLTAEDILQARKLLKGKRK